MRSWSVEYWRGALCFLGLLCCLFYEPLWATVKITAKRDIVIYEEMDTDSNVVWVLSQGQSAFLSAHDYGQWKKVRVNTGAKSQIGYVLKASLRSAEIREIPENDAENRARATYHHRTGLGLIVALSNMNQGARVYDSGDGSPTNIASLSGFSSYFGFILDVPLSSQFEFRTYVLFRNTSMTGKVSVGSGTASAVQLSQSFISTGMLGKFYLHSEGQFWLGVGGEVARGTSATLVYANNTQVPVDTNTLPTFLFVQGVLGYDYNVASSFFVLPEVRLGVVVNAKPVMYNEELMLSVAYAF